ncbi:hypothetical protein [Rhizobium laguerreae]|uniref:hypothetical protein n=1 Tax=Rhizobium laguerreae TaxID=1076926 RepID=UPI00103D160A|nr:hypothetical protein [Rhizobium laguerreae]MBY3382539.1 hypothetical protein [Rhizobium laguerreae]TBY10374.1 hypothetical protein E0J21_09010 [Rhizobium laguerreae]
MTQPMIEVSMDRYQLTLHLSELSGEISFEARILQRFEGGDDLRPPDSRLLIEGRNAEDHMGGEVAAA